MKVRGFEPVSPNFLKSFRSQEDVYLPLRGTKTSAGYDFYAVCDLDIPPQSTIKFMTDVKAYMQPNEVLLIDVRSSMGIKNDLMISNTLGVVDSDYHSNPDNDGNIGIFLRNLKPQFKFGGYDRFNLPTNPMSTIAIPMILDLTEQNTIHIKKGDRVAQGFFVGFLESDNCNSDIERTGGTGSTGSK